MDEMARWVPKRTSINPYHFYLRLKSYLPGHKLVWLREFDNKVTLAAARWLKKKNCYLAHRFWPNFRPVYLMDDGSITFPGMVSQLPPEENEIYIVHWIVAHHESGFIGQAIDRFIEKYHLPKTRNSKASGEQVFMYVKNFEVYASLKPAN